MRNLPGGFDSHALPPYMIRGTLVILFMEGFKLLNYADNSPGYEHSEKLDELIRNRKIISFRRSGTWVKIGLDPVRRNSGVNYNGPERRGK